MLPRIFRTFILEDQYFDLEAILAILSQIPEIHMIGNCAFPDEAIEICKQIQPDLIIVDGSFYGDKAAGPSFVKNVRKHLPHVIAFGLTRYPDCLDVLKRAGCDYVVNKMAIENQDDMLRFLRETIFSQSE